MKTAWLIALLVLAALSPTPAQGAGKLGIRARKASVAKKDRTQKEKKVIPARGARLRSMVERKSGPQQQAKNRGALATLVGLAKGQTVPLTDPTTGRLDRKAAIVELGTDRWSKTPHAWIRFSNGLEVRYAAEHIQLVGKPMAMQKRYLEQRRQDLFAAIERYTGVSTEGIKLRSLRGRNWGPRKRKRKNGPILGPFLSANGIHLEPDEGSEGFERNRTAYLSRHYAAFDNATVTHEVLHAMSEPFLQAGRQRGALTLVEGLTDYFAFKVARPTYGAEPNPDHAYYDYYRFANHVVRTIGESTAKSLFFSKDGSGVEKMAERYDRAVGKPGALAEHVKALEEGRLRFGRGGPSIAE